MRRDLISTHHEFDDARHWTFVRDSRLPRDTFDSPHDPDRWVFAASVVLALVLAALWAGGWLA